ncbi:MAG: 50S ribosomal protein L20 [Planctomycetes bacterium]|nr:50S ribosomal protein L20 [Planctomycetota bacterium]
MSRSTYGAARNKKKRRVMKGVRGYRGATGKQWRLAKEAIVRAGVNAYRDRHRKKRLYRALWITRLTAACRMRGIAYSRFIFGLLAAGIELNRKVLSEIAITSPGDFDKIVDMAKKHQPKSAKAA